MECLECLWITSPCTAPPPAQIVSPGFGAATAVGRTVSLVMKKGVCDAIWKLSPSTGRYAVALTEGTAFQ